MKLQRRSAVAAISSITTVAMMLLASYAWEHTAWPSREYKVQLGDTSEASLQCEILTTFYGATRIIHTYNQADRKYSGCFLYVKGRLNQDGSFVVYRKPVNFLSVYEWTWTATQRRPVIKAQHLQGICPVEAGSSETELDADPRCKRLLDVL
jgi:hypothetical protein